MTEQGAHTENVILEAAKKLFNQKGFDGATVQDIATEAGTTKSMVNYYFRSKEKLFGAVFAQEFKKFFGGMASIIHSDLPLYEIIKQIVALDTGKLSEYPELPVFIVNEINRNPDIVFSFVNAIPSEALLGGLTKKIDEEVKKGTIRKIKAEDLLLNIQALTIFPFLAKPLMRKVFGLSEEQYKQKIRERKKAVVEVIWSSLKI